MLAGGNKLKSIREASMAIRLKSDKRSVMGLELFLNCQGLVDSFGVSSGVQES